MERERATIAAAPDALLHLLSAAVDVRTRTALRRTCRRLRWLPLVSDRVSVDLCALARVPRPVRIPPWLVGCAVHTVHMRGVDTLDAAAQLRSSRAVLTSAFPRVEHCLVDVPAPATKPIVARLAVDVWPAACFWKPSNRRSLDWAALMRVGRSVVYEMSGWTVCGADGGGRSPPAAGWPLSVNRRLWWSQSRSAGWVPRVDTLPAMVAGLGAGRRVSELVVTDADAHSGGTASAALLWTFLSALDATGVRGLSLCVEHTTKRPLRMAPPPAPPVLCVESLTIAPTGLPSARALFVGFPNLCRIVVVSPHKGHWECLYLAVANERLLRIDDVPPVFLSGLVRAAACRMRVPLDVHLTRWADADLRQWAGSGVEGKAAVRLGPCGDPPVPL